MSFAWPFCTAAGVCLRVEVCWPAEVAGAAAQHKARIRIQGKRRAPGRPKRQVQQDMAQTPMFWEKYRRGSGCYRRSETRVPQYFRAKAPIFDPKTDSELPLAATMNRILA